MRAMDYFKCECGGFCSQTNKSKKSENFALKRTRKCGKCGKIYHTLELSYDDYTKSVGLLNDIIKIIKSRQQ